MKVAILLLGLFVWQDTPSKVLIKVSDYEGEATSAKIEIYQDKNLVVSEQSKGGNYETQLPKGEYHLKVSACDTIAVPIKIWNKEHEYQIAVKTDCD